MLLQASLLRSNYPTYFTKRIKIFQNKLRKQQRHNSSFQRATTTPQEIVFPDFLQQINLSQIQTEGVKFLKDLPPEAVPIGAGIAVILVLLGVVVSQQGSEESKEVQSIPQAKSSTGSKKEIPKENCVLVIGGTGRSGVEIVKKLLSQGRSVVVAARSIESAKEAFQDIPIGQKSGSGGVLYVEPGVDITKVESITANLFKGVSQIVLTVGSSQDITPEEVDYKGVQNVLSAAKQHLQPLSLATEKLTAINPNKWEAIDDVIMGGKSSSKLEAMGSGTLTFSGNVIVEDGGFCGTRIRGMDGLAVAGFDGVSFRVKGDGSTFKMNIKTSAQPADQADIYQAVFDTVKDAWTEVRLPWWQFQYVKLDGGSRNVSHEKPPLNPQQTGEKVTGISILYSRFNFNRLPNPNFRAGEFSLELEEDIKLYKDEVPSVVLVSSASVERNAIIGDNLEMRSKDIPIVQMNPKNVLDWKFQGENLVRQSGMPYTIIRPTGLTNDEDYQQDDSFLDIQQGDYLFGRIGRSQVANTVSAALNGPWTVGKTFEVTKNEAAYAKDRKMSTADFRRMFLGLCVDWQRTRCGLPPLPMAFPVQPTTPLSEEEESQEYIKAEQWIEAWRGKNSQISEKTSHEKSRDPVQGNGFAPNVKEAADWIAAWKSKTNV